MTIANSHSRIAYPAPPVRIKQKSTVAIAPAAGVAPYRLEPARYIEEKLGWTPWAGTAEHPGQVEVLDAYASALAAQLEQPDVPCRNRIRVEAGHTVGKTTLAAGIVSHFFDCFPPAIVYCFAPGYDQINDLLFKEIRKQRVGHDLPGRVLETPEIKYKGDHFAKGRATNDSRGRGTERIQGQHGPYLLFVLDEAEGIDDYVWDAVDSMTSGGLSIVLMLANPRTRTSRFHQARSEANVVNFRIPCMYHPNVLEGREVIPGAVKRQYVEEMIEKHCQIVEAHREDDHTFEVPWRPGIIYRPNAEYLFRVAGIAPANIADNTFAPVGRYEAATKRGAIGEGPAVRMGVDVARYGSDLGTLYIRRGAQLWRAAQFAQQNSSACAHRIREEALALAAQGVTSLHIRVDGGGGYGGGVIDKVNEFEDVRQAFEDFRVLEVHFNGTPSDATSYADTATEIYAHTADALHVLSITDAPPALEADLCERTYTWVKMRGVDVKKLEPKEAFKKRKKRSPDDGDGAALAAAPDYVFGPSAADLVGFV